MKLLITIYILLCLSGCYFFQNSYSEYLRQAEECSRSKNYPEAIAAYEKHIKYRQDLERPEWENPAFYQLLIGDLYLQSSDVNSAIKAYEGALTQGVDKLLVADRIRATALWFLEKKQFNEGLELLKKHRELDSLLMDSTLDRIARAMSGVM